MAKEYSTLLAVLTELGDAVRTLRNYDTRLEQLERLVDRFGDDHDTRIRDTSLGLGRAMARIDDLNRRLAEVLALIDPPPPDDEPAATEPEPDEPMESGAPLVGTHLQARPVDWYDATGGPMTPTLPEIGGRYTTALQNLGVTRMNGRPIYSQMRHRARLGGLLTYSNVGYLHNGAVTNLARPRWVSLEQDGADYLVGVAHNSIRIPQLDFRANVVDYYAEASHEAGWAGRFATVEEHQISVWQIPRLDQTFEPEVLHHFPLSPDGGRVNWAAISRSGRYLVVQTGDPSQLLAHEIGGGRGTRVIWDGHSRHCDLGQSTDGRDVVYVEGRPNPSLTEIDLATGAERILAATPWGAIQHLSAQGPPGYVLGTARQVKPADTGRLPLLGMVWIASDQHPDRLIHLAYHHSQGNRYWTLPMATWSVLAGSEVCVAWGTDLRNPEEAHVGHGMEVIFTREALEKAFNDA